MEIFLDRNNSINEISVSELAKQSGLNISTTSRIASTLVKRGYLKQAAKRGKYSLGMKFLDYSSRIKSSMKIREIAMPYLIKLSREVNESVIIGVLNELEGINLCTLSANHALKIVPEEGSSIPLYCTGVGKALLAYLPEKKLEEYGKKVVLTKHLDNTITNFNDLKKHLIIVRQEGIASEDEEYILGVRNIATIIRDEMGNVIAAIGVIGPAIRLTRSKIQEDIPVLKKYALEISKSMGYREE